MKFILRWPLMVVRYLGWLVLETLSNLSRTRPMMALIFLAICIIRYHHERKQFTPPARPSMFVSADQARYPSMRESLIPNRLTPPRVPPRQIPPRPVHTQLSEPDGLVKSAAVKKAVRPTPQAERIPMEMEKPTLPASERLPQILDLSESIGVHLRARRESMESSQHASLLAVWQQNDAELRSLSRQLTEPGVSPERKARLESQVERLEDKNAELDRAAWDYGR